MKRYILRAWYQAAYSKWTVADFIVTNPVVTPDGVYATSRTLWGGETRNFYPAHTVVSLKEE